MLCNGRLLTTTTAMFFQVLGWILFSSDYLRSPGILTLGGLVLKIYSSS